MDEFQERFNNLSDAEKLEIKTADPSVYAKYAVSVGSSSPSLYDDLTQGLGQGVTSAVRSAPGQIAGYGVGKSLGAVAGLIPGVGGIAKQVLPVAGSVIGGAYTGQGQDPLSALSGLVSLDNVGEMAASGLGGLAGGGLGSLAGPLGAVAGAAGGSTLGATAWDSLAQQLGIREEQSVVKSLGQNIGGGLSSLASVASGNLLKQGGGVANAALGTQDIASLQKGLNKFPSKRSADEALMQIDPDRQVGLALGLGGTSALRSQGMLEFETPGFAKALNKFSLLKDSSGQDLNILDSGNRFDALNKFDIFEKNIKDNLNNLYLKRMSMIQSVSDAEPLSLFELDNERLKTIEDDASITLARANVVESAKNSRDSLSSDIYGVTDEEGGVIKQPHNSLGDSFKHLENLYKEIREQDGYNLSPELAALKKDNVKSTEQVSQLKLQASMFREALADRLDSYNLGDGDVFRSLGDDIGVLTRLERSVKSSASEGQQGLAVKPTNRMLQNNLALNPLSKAGVLDTVKESVGFDELAENKRIDRIVKERPEQILSRLSLASRAQTSLENGVPQEYSNNIGVVNQNQFKSGLLGAAGGYAAGQATGIPFAGLAGGIGGAFAGSQIPFNSPVGAVSSGVNSFGAGMASPLASSVVGQMGDGSSDVLPPLAQAQGLESLMGSGSTLPDGTTFSALTSGMLPERNFKEGLPRDSNQWDMKALATFGAGTIAQKDGRSPIALEMIKKFQGAAKNQNVEQKRAILSDMSRIFPDMFEAGQGIDNRLIHPEDQKEYLNTLRRGMEMGTVDSEFYSQQFNAFNVPGDHRVLPYQKPKNQTIKQRIFSSKKEKYDY
jgi:hypothetical protein